METGLSTRPLYTQAKASRHTGKGLSTHIEEQISVDKNLRQMERGMVDEDGNDITGYWVVADAGGAMLFDEMANARRWANNKNMVNIELAPSLTYIESGNSSVSLLDIM